MDRVAGEFPVVTQDGAGRAALRSWVTDVILAAFQHLPQWPA